MSHKTHFNYCPTCPSQKWHAYLQQHSPLSTSPLSNELHAILGAMYYRILSAPVTEPSQEMPSSMKEGIALVPKRQGIFKAQLCALLQSSTLHRWVKVIAEAVRKLNSADASMGLAPYQCLGTATWDVPLTMSVRKLQHGALMPAVIKGQHPLLVRARDSKSGEGTLEWVLDWQQTSRLDRILLARGQKMSWPDKVVPIDPARVSIDALCMSTITKINTIEHCNWLFSMVFATPLKLQVIPAPSLLGQCGWYASPAQNP